MSNKKLEKYKSKRDFSKTGEPSGERRKKNPRPLFVIQKHDAQNLHYDLRLEIGDVLKSWAVPKGPSTGTGDKRLAAPTEDHPLEYADFEGVIPEEEYGAGPVMIWDTGTYRNLRAEDEEDGMDMDESYKDGKIKVWLNGKKVKGGYSLIKTGKDWLLIKMSDRESDARRNPVRSEPASVKTGRTLDEIREEG
ncbi:MAG: DNA polymerase ligase N-terminal domain-containing protein [Bacteroidales bacterium]